MTREEYLGLAAERLAPLFVEAGAPLPADIQIGVGLPSSAARARRNQAIGECWSPEKSAAKRFEIFVSPVLGDVLGAMATLVHELVHAAVGVKEGHRGRFAKVAKKLGLLPPMRATTAGPELKARLNAISTDLGPYPHAALDVTKPERKPQATRLRKVSCPGCGYVARIAQSWIERGLPTCICGTEWLAEVPFPEDEFETLTDPLTGREFRIPTPSEPGWDAADFLPLRRSGDNDEAHGLQIPAIARTCAKPTPLSKA